MLSNDIFNFEFVDRQSERDSVDKFLSDSEKSDSVLWLSGKQGIGKSYFLKEYVMKKYSAETVYINGELNNLTQGYYAKKLLSQLNTLSDMRFLSFIRNNYKDRLSIQVQHNYEKNFLSTSRGVR